MQVVRKGANHPRFIANLDRPIAPSGVPQNSSLSRIAIRKTYGKVHLLLIFQNFTAQRNFLPMQHYYTIMRSPHEAKIGGGNMDKLTGLATVLGIILAIVAGVVPIPALDVGLILLVLGVIGGIGANQDGAIRIYLAVLVLPAIAVGLGGVPMVGGYLGAIFANLRSEEHTSELQSLMRNSYAVFCLKKKILQR